jgi:RNA polymerase sigma-70 factor (ECF subfamily)
MEAEPKRGGIPGRTGTSRSQELDPEILARARRREVDAFEALYHASVGRVLALCNRLCGDPDGAQDLTQEVFLRVWERIDRFEGRSGFFTWLYRVTVNRVTDGLRAEIRREAREIQVDDGPLALAASGRRSRQRIEPVDLERAMAKLPTGARIVFVLHDVEGYRHAEIAEMTGIATGTSKAQLHRARRLLRAQLSL